MSEKIVDLEEGKIEGTTLRNTKNVPFSAFLGIPYGKPPTGKLRFKDPLPAEGWQGIRDATKPGASCPNLLAKPLNLRQSEDCLLLNVYTPINKFPAETAQPKPVIVSIHGGAFTVGTGDISFQNPSVFMTQDVVLITINYRLGAFGFLSIDDLSIGNAGLKDTVLALKWVQRNVGKFGGNPANVTVFGVSAGGAAVHYLTLSSAAKGLFHKAIAHSGSALNCWANGVNNNHRSLAKIAGLEGEALLSDAEILDYLQSIPFEELLKAQTSLGDWFDNSRKRLFCPVVERPSQTSFISKEPIELIVSNEYQNDIPLIVGFCSHEGLFQYLIQPEMAEISTKLSVPHYLMDKRIVTDEKEIQEINDEINRFYFGDQVPNENDKEKRIEIASDVYFIRGIYGAIKHQWKTATKPIYMYKFSAETALNCMRLMYPIPVPGVCHGDDVHYFFPSAIQPPVERGSVEDVTRERFLMLWMNFVRFGDPNPPLTHDGDSRRRLLGDFEWKPIESEAIEYFEFGETLQMRSKPAYKSMEFWDRFFAKFQLHY